MIAWPDVAEKANHFVEKTRFTDAEVAGTRKT